MSIDPNDLPGADADGDKAITGRDGRKWYLEDYVKELRHESATNRIRARDAEAKLAQGDPDALTKAQAEIRELKVGQALTDAALRLGANARLLRATLQMDGHLNGLDPNKADFLPAIESLVQTAITNEPSLKGAVKPTIPVRAGSDISHPGTSRPLGKDVVTRGDLVALRAAGKHDEVATLLRTGALDAVLRGEA